MDTLSLPPPSLFSSWRFLFSGCPFRTPVLYLLVLICVFFPGPKPSSRTFARGCEPLAILSFCALTSSFLFFKALPPKPRFHPFLFERVVDVPTLFSLYWLGSENVIKCQCGAKTGPSRPLFPTASVVFFFNERMAFWEKPTYALHLSFPPPFRSFCVFFLS